LQESVLTMTHIKVCIPIDSPPADSQIKSSDPSIELIWNIPVLVFISSETADLRCRIRTCVLTNVSSIDFSMSSLFVSRIVPLEQLSCVPGKLSLVIKVLPLKLFIQLAPSKPILNEISVKTMEKVCLVIVNLVVRRNI
jgi:hypothetical protein